VRSDVAILFASRGARLFAYGFLSVVLALYLDSIGLSERAIGLVLTFALIGDAVVSLAITTSADRVGRRRMLITGALLMAGGAVAFASTEDPALLMLIAALGVFSPSGHEVGPFLSIEQASLSQLVPPARRTHVFARYTLTGSFATAAGALAGGGAAAGLQRAGMGAAEAYRALVWAYAAFGVVLFALFARLSRDIEAPSARASARSMRSIRTRFGLHRSRGAVARLSALFALDSFAGGFIIQSLLALWFHVRFGFDVASLGALFFGANLIAGISAIFAARIAARIGLVNTMVVTHLPSNVLLCLVPLMPGPVSAVAVLLSRYTISQMDVPTRQSYTMAIVDPDERSAAAGITGIARSVGASLSPAVSGALMATGSFLSAPFFLAGGLKIVYDLLVYHGFKAHKPSEE
jgi:MFS family permease